MVGGAAVVATDAGGVGDVVHDGVTGLLTPLRDSNAVASAIERLLDDPDLRQRVAARARAFVERTCSEHAMTEAYLGIYVDALARRRRR
jgi:glycosyltransferase involved in cell wall biosynthesis